MLIRVVGTSGSKSTSPRSKHSSAAQEYSNRENAGTRARHLRGRTQAKSELRGQAPAGMTDAFFALMTPASIFGSIISSADMLSPSWNESACSICPLSSSAGHNTVGVRAYGDPQRGTRTQACAHAMTLPAARLLATLPPAAPDAARLAHRQSRSQRQVAERPPAEAWRMISVKSTQVMPESSSYTLSLPSSYTLSLPLLPSPSLTCPIDMFVSSSS